MNAVQKLIKAVRWYKTFGKNGLTYLIRKSFPGRDLLEANILKQPLYIRPRTSDEGIFEVIFYHKLYDQNYHVCPRTIVDCGANSGLATVFFRNKYPESTIVAIEPERSNFEMLKKNTENYDNIICINAGIWSKKSHLEIVEGDDHEKCSFVVKEVEEPTTSTIEALSIGDIVDQFSLDTIDILKIDIEGTEKEIFESGFERWLPKVKSMIIEFHDWIRPGASLAFFKAMSNYKFTMEPHGENILFVMHQ